jgi:hypothetical protein
VTNIDPKVLPLSNTLDEIKFHIRQTYGNPNVGATYQILLKDGPRAFRIATIFQILNAETREIHHYSLRVDQYNRSKDGWTEYPPHCVWIAAEADELPKLFRFIQPVVEGTLPKATGAYRIIDEETYTNVEELAKLFEKADSSEKLQLMKALLKEIGNTTYISSELTTVLETSNGELLRSISVAARMVQYRTAYEELSHLVSTSSTSESALQKVLESNPWLFGSEYSELLKKRKWTRDNQLDFMLRRTVDNYLEIVEIKTPFSDPLMVYDKSHDAYYPSSKLSTVIGQVMRYIAEVERQHDYILALDNADTLKIRARIIVGRDGNQDQQQALRNLNAHLHRIEILTFDQLLRMGKRTLDLFQEQMDVTDNERIASDETELDEIPF